MKSHLFFHLRRCGYTLAGLVGRFGHPPVTIFCYHGISDSPWRFNVTPAQFSRHIAYLTTHYQLISLSDVLAYLHHHRPFSRPAAVITFDDGYANLHRLIPFFKRHRITPAIFVLSNPSQANVTEMNNHYRLLTPAQIKSLDQAGWTIGCHSATHPDFTGLTSTELHTEVTLAKLHMERLLGHQIDFFAYPKGVYSPSAKAAVATAGFKLAFSMDAGAISFASDPLTLPRVGIDASHSFVEFQAAPTRPAIWLRRLFAQTILAKAAV